MAPGKSVTTQGNGWIGAALALFLLVIVLPNRFNSRPKSLSDNRSFLLFVISCQVGTRLKKLPPGQTLQPTALVHEAYIRVVGDDDPGWDGRGHFFGAAHTMERYRSAFYAPLASDWSNFGQWTEAGAKTATERANGMRRETDYDAAGRVVSIRNLRDGAIESTAVVGYAEGRLRSLEDSVRGGVELYSYDAADRVVQVEYPDGEILLLSHDFDCASTRSDLFQILPFVCKITLTRRPKWVEGEGGSGPRKNRQQNIRMRPRPAATAQGTTSLVSS